MGLRETLGLTSQDPGAPAEGGDSRTPELQEIAEESRRARRTRSDAGKPRARKPRVAEGATSEVSDEEVRALFEAENWRELASLYFDTRFVMTGFEPFRLTDPEEGRLAQTLATTMKVLLRIDPKYVAILVFTATYGGMIAAKEAAWSQEKVKRTPPRAPATVRRPADADAARAPFPGMVAPT